MKLSFCIPTLNRPVYLINTIRSICIDKSYCSQFEICIYNNSSNLDYIEVEEEIKNLSKEFNIKYKKGCSRLEIDQSMFEVINLAEGEYLFLIGDDDYLLANGLVSIIDLIDGNDFDLAIFNAVILNEKNKTLTKMFNIPDVYYFDLKKSLVVLKNYCSYGNILVKSNFINVNDFKYLEGTSHAYGCFWLSFFKNYEIGIEPKIIISNSDVVCLRAIAKTYNLLQVTFQHSQKEFSLYYNYIGQKSAGILKEYEQTFWREQSGFIKLFKYGMAGNELLKIKCYNYFFYRKYFIKIIFINVLSIVFKPFKNFFKFFMLINKKRYT